MAEEAGVIESLKARFIRPREGRVTDNFGVDIEADTHEIEEAILASDDFLKKGWDTDSLSSQYVNLIKQAAQKIPTGERQAFDIVRRNLLSLAKNGSIEVDGQTLRLPSIRDEMPGRSNFRDFIYFRAFAMRLYIEQPDLLIEALKNRVIGVHGSHSASLWGVLELGLRPQDRLLEIDSIVASGEHGFGAEGISRKHVSFNQWYSRGAADYANSTEEITEESLEAKLKHFREREREEAKFGPGSLISYEKAIKHAEKTLNFLRKPDKTKEEKIQELLIRQNFPILYTFKLGSRVSKVDSHNPNIVTPISDIDGEFAVRDGVPISEIPIILVPQNRVEQVRKLIEIKAERQEVPKVMAMEGYQRALDSYRVRNEDKAA